MSIIQGSAMQGASRGFYPKELTGSLRFNDDDTAYLTWTPDSNPTGAGVFTFSCWFKIGNLGVTKPLFYVYEDGSNFAQIAHRSDNKIGVYSQAGASAGLNVTTQALFRDPSAWYHLLVKFNSTSGNLEIKVYINGVNQSLTTTTAMSVHTTKYAANGVQHWVGTNFNQSSLTDGYMAEVFFIDGTAHDADAFGETKNGVWVPKDITASDFTMGTNGFHLTFEDDTEVEAFNTVLYRGTSQIQSVTGTGFSPDLVWAKVRNSAGTHILTDSVRGGSKQLFSNLTNAEATSSIKITGFESDGFTLGADSGAGTGDANYSGNTYVAWCWDAGANNAVTGHSSVTWQGSGSDVKVSGLPFSPDLVWAKSSSNGTSHALFDTVRGTGKMLNTNNAVAEISNSQYGYLDSFDKDGFHFQLGTSDGTYGTFSGHEYVAWCWDAGDSDPVSNTQGDVTSTVKASTANGFSVVTYTATGSGDIEVGHGLSQAPDFIIGKTRNQAYDWRVYHSAVGATKTLQLNGTNAASTNNAWGQTEPTSTVFTAGRGGDENMNFASGDTIVAYCFHDVAGKQKFGSYTGDGTSDGSKTITTGFRPGFLMVKRTDSAENWQIVDGSRDPLNNVDGLLWANLSNAESTADFWEFTDTGFKIINSNTEVNANGGTYIYAAFAGSYSDFITDYNTDGSIDSRVKASDTTGFSIVSFTDPNNSSKYTVGHGLSATPNLVIVKDRTNGSSNWLVSHSGLTNQSTYYMTLNTTAAQDTYTEFWGDGMTSDYIGMKSGIGVLGGADCIAYCWTATTGVSAFGSYTGNGSTTGPTVTCGFKVAWLMVKRSDGGAETWAIHDNTRSVSNPTEAELWANLSNAEQTSGTPVDLLSNGFQVKNTAGQWNTSGATYIYAAFADTREAAFWLDQSGNDNDWQPVNLDHNDTVSDSPTNNFCTMNPIAKFGTPSAFTLANGNLDLTFTSLSGNDSAVGTMGVSSGKFYYEVELVSHADDANAGFTTAEALATETNTNGAAYYKSIGFQRGDRGVVWGSEPSPTQRFNALQNGDVVGFALDLDALKLYIHVNGSDSPVATLDVPTDKGDTFIPCCGDDGGDAGQFKFNFGQQPFKYGPPE